MQTWNITIVYTLTANILKAQTIQLDKLSKEDIVWLKWSLGELYIK